jgi:outer membrane lipoprotein carrier protein
MKITRVIITATVLSCISIAMFAVDEPEASAKKAPPLTAKQVSDKVQAFYDRTKTYQAKFNQTYKIKAHNKKKKSSGTVVFEKPGKMSWVYDKPNGNRVVSDGKILKVFEKDNKQMFKQKVGKSQYPAALAFLMGKGDLSKSFNLEVLDSTRMKFEGGYVLQGKPKESSPAYQKVLFYVDGPTSQVRRVLILDAQGNQNKFDFHTPKVNEKLDSKMFTFTPPKGTQVIEP